MYYRLAICDDEAAEAARLSALAEGWATAAQHTVNTATFPSAEALLMEQGSGGLFDILLLDVEMGGMDGITLAKQLRAAGCSAQIIFVTSHFEFAAEGYEVDALHYLTKPVSSERLAAVLTRAAEKLAAAPPTVLVRCEGETVLLAQRDILYAEAFLHYISIHTQDGSEYRIKESISAFAARVGEGFFKNHRSYLVNLAHVARIGRDRLTLADGRQLPLARGLYDAVNREFIACH